MNIKDIPRIQKPVPYDWFSPFVAVTLFTKDGEYPLWTGEVQKPDPAAQFEGTNLAVLQEVLIEWQGAFYQATINLSPNYDDAIAIVDSFLIEMGKTMVAIEMGFRTSGEGQFSQTFNGVVEGVDFTVGTEISLTLKTVPPAMAAGKQRQADGKNKAEPWNDKSALEIIKELWEGNKQFGLVYKVELPKEEDTAIKMLKKKRKTFARSGQTDWAVIKKLCDLNFCVVQADGMRLRIDSLAHSMGKKMPIATFHLFSGGGLGGDEQAYPITSVSLKTSDLFARTLAGTKTVGVDEKTGKPVAKTLGLAGADKPGADVGAQTKGKASKKPGGGPSPDASVVPEGGARQALVKDPNDEVEGQRELARTIKEWQHQGIELEVETLLIPHLTPHENINISGLGTRIDGRYWISKLFFQIGPDGGLTRFECVRIGLREGPGHVPSLPGGVNTAPDPEPVDRTEKKAESQDDNPYTDKPDDNPYT